MGNQYCYISPSGEIMEYGKQYFWEEKEAFNHKDTLVQVEAKAPTCTEIGWDAYEYCTACTYTTYVEKEALKHSFTKYEVTEEAKCGVEGKEVAYCDNGCGATDEKAIEALTHKDADGDYKCDNGCGHEFEKPAPEEPTPDTPDEPTDEACDHLCHKGGFIGFIWKIVKFFSPSAPHRRLGRRGRDWERGSG